MSSFIRRTELLETIKNGSKTYFKKTYEGKRTLGFIRTTKESFNQYKSSASRLECLVSTTRKGIIRHYCTAVTEYENRFLCGNGQSFTI